MESQAFTIEETNLWVLPNIYISEEEMVEDKMITEHATNGTLKDSDLRDFQPLSVHINRGNGEYKSVECTDIIVSNRTNRVVFINQQMIAFQKRMNFTSLGGSVASTVEFFEPNNLVSIRGNPLYRQDMGVWITFKSLEDYTGFSDYIQNQMTMANGSLRVMPEVFATYGEELVPIKDFLILRYIGEVFTDFALGDSHQIYDAIANIFSLSLNGSSPHGNSRMKINAVLKSQTLPRIIISDTESRQSQDLLSIEELQIQLNKTRLILSNPLAALPKREPVTIPDTIMRQYGAHVRQHDSTMTNSVIHVHVKLLDLMGAAFQARFKSSILATIAMFKITLVHEIAHWVASAVHGSDFNPTWLNGAEWATTEMYDQENQLDAGLITEVMWLGHAAHLIDDKDGYVKLWVRQDIDPPTIDSTEHMHNSEDLVPGEIIADEVLEVFKGIALPLGPIFKHNAKNTKVDVRARHLLRGLAKQSRPPPPPSSSTLSLASEGSRRLFSQSSGLGHHVKVKVHSRPRDVFRV